MIKDPSRRRFPLSDRMIEVVDDTLTGEVLLDEALKMMKSSEKMSVSSWIDLMSGTKRPLGKFGTWVLTHYRRNMEPHENWIPAQASARKASKRIG